jgi:hypothetical protein
MLKETVTYTDFNNVTRTEDLYFNLTKTEMSDLLGLQPRLEKWAESTSGDPRDLSMAEIRELLEIIKLLVEKAYGVKTEDGRHFRKSPEAWADFKDSAAYDAFVFGLFEDPLKAVGFMNGILPQDLANRETVQLAQKLAAVPDIPEAKLPPIVPEQGDTYTAVEEEIPAWMRENRDPTTEEFRKMSDTEKLAAFQAKSQRNQ